MTARKDDRLWGGRFDKAPDALFDAFQNSFAFDCRLLPYELAVDRAWARALQRSGLLTESEVAETLAALDKIAERGDKRWRSMRPNSLYLAQSFELIEPFD